MNRRTIITAGLVAAAMLSLAGSAVAQTSQEKALVDAAKARGAVGEQADGYLGFVAASDDAALKAAVAAINAARATYYRRLAAQRGVTEQVVGEATALQLLRDKVKTGEYHRTADGEWRRK